MNINIELLKKAQKEQGLTDQALADKAGLGRTRVWTILNGGVADVKLSTINAIAEALGFDVNEIVSSEKQATETQLERMAS